AGPGRPGRRPGPGAPRRPRRRRSASLPALLHELADEVLGVGFEDLIDLVQDVVDVGVQLFVARGRLGGGLGLLDLFVPPSAVLLPAGVLGRHPTTSSIGALALILARRAPPQPR